MNKLLYEFCILIIKYSSWKVKRNTCDIFSMIDSELSISIMVNQFFTKTFINFNPLRRKSNELFLIIESRLTIKKFIKSNKF
jgi:hypothetical protein